jgi:hypothetical protein
MQKKLYNVHVTFEILRLPTCWCKVMAESEMYSGQSNGPKKIPLRNKKNHLLKKLWAEEKLQTHLLETLKAGENFMDTLNLKITKELTNICIMQNEAANWNRLYNNFNVLNYCYVHSVGALHDDTLQPPNEPGRCHEQSLPRRKIPKKIDQTILPMQEKSISPCKAESSSEST